MLLERNTLSDDVVTVIRKMIMNGEFKPGERINQVELAERLNISRGPVREAMRLLQNEGLIKHEINRGTFVATLSYRDAFEIYTLRALLESEAAQLACKNITRSDIEKLEKLLEQFQQKMQEGDLEAQVELDIEFHSSIVKASKHSRLISVHQQYNTQVAVMYLTVANKVPYRIDQVVLNHKILLESLETKDLDQIKKVFSEHYLQALEDLKMSNDDD